jgi:hypothetical protein
MKLKRMAAVMLALLLILPAAVPMVSAAGFSDVTGSWTWAEEYIDDMTQQGVFKGYEDGTFRPANKLTAAEALALCARCAGLSDSVKSSIADDRADEIEGVLGTSLSWFHEDFAVCLELGVLTSAQLKSLWQSGALSEPILKEDFAVYLVRSMGLDKLADSLENDTVTFADASSISDACLPYVYLLNAYGIVEGTEENKFEPRSTVNRAVSAAMLSRVVKFMKEKSLTVELAGYTDYDWASGIVVSAVAGDDDTVLLTLEVADGEEEYTLDSDVPIYQNNMKGTTAALKEGMYARVNLNDDEPISVRLAPEDRLKTISAEISALTADSLTLEVGGVDKVYSMDRFTRVTTGGQTGGTERIDTTSGYTDAQCTVDGSDVLMVELTGGTTLQAGLLSDVSVGTSTTVIQVTSFDGLPRTFTVPSSATITVNGLKGSLKASYEGYYISMRVSNDVSGQVASAAVDTDTDYIQCKVLGITYTSSPNTVYALNLSSGDSVVYDMAYDPEITYEGSTVTFKSITKGWYFTAKLDDDDAIEVFEAYDSEVIVEGTLTAISYDTTTIITVTADDGEQYAFSLDMTDLPDFTRDDEDSSIDKLRTGDSVTVTSKYNEVTLIESEPKETGITGTIVRIVKDSGGTTMELTLEDGTDASYTVTQSASVTDSDGDTISLSALEPGDTVSVAVSGTQVLSIEVQEEGDNSSSSQEITGTVLYVNTTDKTILLRLTDSDDIEYIITVNTPTGTTIMTIGGSYLSLSKLEIGDELILYGAYDSGEFDADLVIRK